MASDGGDSGAASGRSSTAPGIGPSSAPKLPASGRRIPNAHDPHREGNGAVDFDALSAALGGRPPSGHGKANESQGRSSASYASSRPHSVPAAHVTEDEDPNMPAVIVATDDTVPSAPPHMTTPLAPGMPYAAPLPVGPPSQPRPASLAPITPMPHMPSQPFTPPPFAVPRGAMHPTMRMPERPRRPRAMTVVVRPRGPSAAQKLVAFMAMLVLVTACGIAVIIWRKPGWLGLVPSAPPATAAVTAAPPKGAPAPPSAAPVAAPTVAVPTTTPSSLPAASSATSARAPATTTTTTAPKRAPKPR